MATRIKEISSDLLPASRHAEPTKTLRPANLQNRRIAYEPTKKDEGRYESVQVTNVVEGTTIKGHYAVKAHFEREENMMTAYGASIIIQVYRLNLQADTLEELQGEKLAEVKVDGSFVSKTDIVAVVKDKVRSLLNGKEGMQKNSQAPNVLAIEAADHFTFYLSGRPMQDDTSFYDVNYVMLPVWIQVLLHDCKSEDAVKRINYMLSEQLV